MVMLSRAQVAAIVVFFAVPSFGTPIAEQPPETDAINSLYPRGWTGVKAYSYSDSCGADNKADNSDYTWSGSLDPSKCYNHVVNGSKKDMWSFETSGSWGSWCTGYPYPVLYKGYDCSGNVGGVARGATGAASSCFRYGSNPKDLGSFKSFRLGCMQSIPGK